MNQQTFLQQLADRNKNSVVLPDKQLAEEFINELFNYLFCTKKGKGQNLNELEREFESLKSHLSTIVYDVVGEGEKAQVITNAFFDEIPAVYQLLIKDAEGILKFDPAAQSLEEVLTAYPGFYATAVYRFSNVLYKLGVSGLPRLLTEYAHSKTGVDIHPGAQVGESFFIDHGTGVVIGETAVIGNNVKIYQSVTIGALHASAVGTAKRHPTIEDNVIIYASATILGGETVIGHDSIVGGNVWLTQSVPPFSMVYHKSEIVRRENI